MALFDETELGNWLGKTVTEARATMAERVVWGWLKPILGASVQPDPVPEELFSWAIELAAIAHENPSGLSARDIGPYKEQFSAERRDAILDEVRGSDLAGPAGTSAPQGSFPTACPYPDPIR